MKAFNYFLLVMSLLGGLVVFAVTILWGMSLPETATLWNCGSVNGWSFLILFAFVFALFAWMPAIIIYTEIKSEK